MASLGLGIGISEGNLDISVGYSTGILGAEATVSIDLGTDAISLQFQMRDRLITFLD